MEGTRVGQSEHHNAAARRETTNDTKKIPIHKLALFTPIDHQTLPRKPTTQFSTPHFSGHTRRKGRAGGVQGGPSGPAIQFVDIKPKVPPQC